jgi:flagellar motor protein MotB
MERLMLTHISVTGEDLRELSAQRARAAYAYILNTGKVETERVFLVESEDLSPEDKEDVRRSRVDFRLR